MWGSVDSGTLKSYIAGIVLPVVCKHYNVKYRYINYMNEDLLAEINSYSSSITVVNNADVIAKKYIDTIKSLSSGCSVILIGRYDFAMGLSSEEVTGYVKHSVSEKGFVVSCYS